MKMEMIHKKTVLLCLSVVLTLAVVLTQTAAAKEKETEHVTIPDAVSVGGTMLEAGNYTLVWEGAGPQVQVTFMKGGKTVVTASAKLVAETSRYDGAVRARTLDNKSRVLEAIMWKKKSLVFEPSV